MEDFGLLYDVRTHQFTDDNGYILDAEYVMLNDDRTVIEEIYAGTGVEVDEFFIEILRDTIESTEPEFPW